MILVVLNHYQKFDFYRVFSKHNQRGRDLNSLLQALLIYKLTEYFSISKASDWINRKPVLDLFDLD